MQNNQQQVYIQDIEKAYQKNNQEFENMSNELYRLNQENNYLKQEIKQVESAAMGQQTELQNKYLKEIEEKNRELKEKNEISRV